MAANAYGMSKGLLVYAVAIMVFLVAPIAIVVGVAFTGAEFVSFPPAGFSVRWFTKVLSDPEFLAALWNSVRVGVASTVLSTALAIPAAVALVRQRFTFASGIQAFLLSPLSLPSIILAVGLLFLVARIGLSGTFLALVAGHSVLTVPYVLRTVLAVYSGLNREVEEAATTLGASSYRAFWHVSLPLIMPGVLAGGIFSFLLSFDEVPVALLLTSSNTTTLPVSILSYLVYNYDPAVAAISALQIGVIVMLLLILERTFGLQRMMFTSAMK